MKKVINLKMDEDLHEHVKKMSDKKYMTVTGYINRLIARDKENQQYILGLDTMDQSQAMTFNLPGGIELDAQKLKEYYQKKIIDNSIL